MNILMELLVTCISIYLMPHGILLNIKEHNSLEVFFFKYSYFYCLPKDVKPGVLFSCAIFTFMRGFFVYQVSSSFLTEEKVL